MGSSLGHEFYARTWKFVESYSSQECINDIYMIDTLHSGKIFILIKEKNKYNLILLKFQTFNRSENWNMKINKNEIINSYNLH